MAATYNPHISVDCVVFGFDSQKLRVLLIEREPQQTAQFPFKLKLPGSLIANTEDLDDSAHRTLRELTGIDKIYLKQFGVFGAPNRLMPQADLDWLKATSGLVIDRVVTIAYYSLVKISETNSNPGTIWHDVNSLPELVFDHNKIIRTALAELRRSISTEPVCFELLPKKFTIRQMQNLYQTVLGRTLDNRNFRKKVLPLNYIVQLPEKEIGVAHKPALLYKFDRKTFEKSYDSFFSA